MAWSGEAVIEPGRLVYSGELGSAHLHSHAAVQICVATRKPASLWDAAGGNVLAHVAVIPAGVEHAIEANAATGLMIYLDPTDVRGRKASALVNSDRLHEAPAWASAGAGVKLKSSEPELLSDADALVDRLTDGASGHPTPMQHPAVAQTIQLVPQLLNGPVRLNDVAKAVHLSADRLGRLFAREVGLSFSAYVRWARLIRAMEVVRSGATITDAAHAAGFTDSSHANRAFHAMFGIGPSDARDRVVLG